MGGGAPRWLAIAFSRRFRLGSRLGGARALCARLRRSENASRKISLIDKRADEIVLLLPRQKGCDSHHAKLVLTRACATPRGGLARAFPVFVGKGMQPGLADEATMCCI